MKQLFLIFLIFLFKQIISIESDDRAKFLAEKQRLADNFNRWLIELDSPILKIKCEWINEKYGFGAIATEDIEFDDVYLSLDYYTLMSEHSIFESHIGELMDEMIKKFGRSNSIQLLFYIMIHRKREKSGWKPYIEILPQSFDHLPFYCQQCMEELKDLSIHQFIIDTYEEYEYNFKVLNEKLFQVYKDDFHSYIFNYENFMWAQQILNSRQIWIHNRGYFVPMLDMVNNSDLSDMRPHTTEFNHDRQTFTKASMNFKKGEQVFENYAQPNSNYLTYHGFVVKNNIHDCVDVTFTIYNSQTANFEKKADYIRKSFGNPKQAEYFLKAQQTYCLGLTNLHQNALFAVLKLSFNEHENVEDYAYNVHDVVVYEYILKTLEQKQASFKRTLKEDLIYLIEMRSKDLADNLITSIEYRIEQRLLIDEIIKRYNDLVNIINEKNKQEL